jgi:hypothetical protein
MKHNRIWPAILMSPILLTACGPKNPATPTTDPNLVLTSVAQTVVVLASAMPSSTASPSVTPALTATPLMLPTSTPFSSEISGTVPAVSSTQPAPAPTSIAGTDKVVMVSDLDVPDGTQIDPGAKFTKKWRLMNTGTSTWTTAYSLVHTSGDQIKGPASVPMPAEVGPGKIIDVAVDLVAPTKDGKYTSYWKIKNAGGEIFGIGASGKDAFWVQIQVGGNANPAPTDTPASTPSSATSTPTAAISNLSVDIDNGNVEAKCPYTFTYTAKFKLSQAATVTYHWEASDSKYSLPAPVSNSMPAGDRSVSLAFEVISTASGSLDFHITAPVDITSDSVDFSLTCKP